MRFLSTSPLEESSTFIPLSMIWICIPIMRGNFVFEGAKPLQSIFLKLYQTSWSILDGFSYVVGFDDIGIFQVGDGATYFEDAVEGTGGEVELLHCRLEQALG